MTILIAGIVVFFAAHLFPNLVSTRARLISRLGENGYKGIFSLLSLLGLGLIIWGKASAAVVNIYAGPLWAYKLMPPLMVLAFILMAASGMKTNIKRFTRHPQLWGVTLWSGGHVVVNGDLSSILLFGSFLTYSLLDMFLANLRGAQKQIETVPLSKDIIVIVAGAVVAVAVAFAHPWLFGVKAIV